MRRATIVLFTLILAQSATAQISHWQLGRWSNVYQFSGESFKSDSPRRFMLLEMILATDDPAVAPTVNSVSVEYENALVQGARGSVAPREASPNQDTHFTYSLWPETDDSLGMAATPMEQAPHLAYTSCASIWVPMPAMILRSAPSPWPTKHL